MTQDYNVIVDFSTRSSNDMSDVLHGFHYIDSIGKQQWQVGVGVKADTTTEACSKALKVVKSQLEAYTVHGYQIIGTETYGPENEHTVFKSL